MGPSPTSSEENIGFSPREAPVTGEVNHVGAGHRHARPRPRSPRRRRGPSKRRSGRRPSPPRRRRTASPDPQRRPRRDGTPAVTSAHRFHNATDGASTNERGRSDGKSPHGRSWSPAIGLTHDGTVRELERAEQHVVGGGGRCHERRRIPLDAPAGGGEVHRQHRPEHRRLLACPGDVPELDDRDDAVGDAERRQPAADFDVRHPGGEAGGDHVLDRARTRGSRDRRDAPDGPGGGSGPGGSPISRGQLGRDRAVAGAIADLGIELGERGAESIEVGGQFDVVRRTHRCRGERGGPLPLAPLEGQPGILASHGELETGGDELGDVEGDVGAELGAAELGGELAELVDGGGARRRAASSSVSDAASSRARQQIEPAAGGESEIGAHDRVEVLAEALPLIARTRRARRQRCGPQRTRARDRRPRWRRSRLLCGPHPDRRRFRGRRSGPRRSATWPPPTTPERSCRAKRSVASALAAGCLFVVAGQQRGASDEHQRFTEIDLVTVSPQSGATAR